VAMKASDGVMGGGGGKSPLPFAPNLLGELRVVPTIWNASLVRHITKNLLENDDKYDHT
jgi:hypothetical protein